jgi:hypothetical protein
MSRIQQPVMMLATGKGEGLPQRTRFWGPLELQNQGNSVRRQQVK